MMAMGDKTLTAPQRHYLEEIRAAGEVTYGAKSRQVIHALVRAGLVTAEYGWERDGKGGQVEQITVRPAA